MPVVLYPEPADPDHFRDYYVTNHLPLVMKMPGFEADSADAAAMAASRESPQGRLSSADVANYATGGVVVIDYPVQDGIG
ncbi:EthD family reductase [Nocardia sp. NPDC058658]|uniref:EthD family reductase n=1 Tax=Nocardia sp. NPDC058658 TaxID=3346580 RepID=UPI003659147B